MFDLDDKCQRFILKIIALTFAIHSIVWAQPFPDPPQPWQDDYNISLEDFEFSHPMTVINRTDLEKMKNRIANNIEPQKSAYDQLIAEAETQLNFEPDAPASMNIMGGYEPNSNLSEMRDWLWRNCHAAYSCALAFAYSGETKYADKTIEVLMNWANTGTTFSGQDSGLQLGSWFSPMLYAADLLYDYEGWTDTDRATFKSWWKQNCLINGDVLRVMREKDNNWKDAALLGVMTAAVVLEDTLYLKEALIQLKSYFYNRQDGNVRIKGTGWKITKDDNGVYLPREVVRNDGRSGLTYTAYALTTMVQCFEIARYAGFNFWHKTTMDGATIADVINQYFRWDKMGESFPWHNRPKRTEERRNSYELANTFLQVEPELREWVMSHWPDLNGQQGDEYCTLNKGDLKGSGIAAPQVPSDLSARAVSDKQIDLVWTDNSDNEEGFVIERKTEASSYILLAKVDSNVTTYSDQFFLSANTTYTYRIKAFMGSYDSEYSEEISETTLDKDTKIDGKCFRDDLPYEFALEQNYPNPFNPSTTIRYTLARPAHVNLSVFNLQGQRVDTIVDNYEIAGYYQIRWQPRGLASGVYYYQLTAGPYQKMSKMVYF